VITLIHVTRPLQELMLQARDTTWQLAQDLGRTPAESDIARHLGVSAGELNARQAELALQPSSLDAPLAGQPGMSTLADLLGREDPSVEHMLGMHAVAAHWGELPLLEQKILVMDFYGGLPQAEIGRRPGISPIHVSPAACPCARLPPHVPARPGGPRILTGPAAAPRPRKGP
jgi:RNA polymerase sigma-B factor